MLTTEESRVAVVHGLSLIDMPTNTSLQNLASILREAFQVEMGAVSLVAETSVHFVAQDGLGVACADRDGSFCHYTIAQPQPVEISEFIAPLSDPRFVNNPFVNGDKAKLVYYCGCPIIIDDYIVGSFCVLSQTRTLPASPHEKRLLRALTETCCTLIETQRTLQYSSTFTMENLGK